jgi:hypothetical protein
MKKSLNMAVWFKENNFNSAKLESLQWLVKGATTWCTCHKEYNKCDLTAVQCF